MLRTLCVLSKFIFINWLLCLLSDNGHNELLHVYEASKC